MEILRNNEEQVMCPYNSAHFIRRGRLDVHLVKCRNAYKMLPNKLMAICDFNAAHRIPQPELQYHLETCPDRKSIELMVYETEAERNHMPQYQNPVIPAPVDTSWDDEEVPTYNPEKYCEENAIIRHLDTKSAAQRREFRIAERLRFNNIAETKKKEPKKNDRGFADGCSEDELPPMPAFAPGRPIERSAADIKAALQKKSFVGVYQKTK